MDGVQFVLHNPQYTVDYTWGWSWGGFFISIVVLVGIASIIICFKNKDFDSIMIISILTLMFGTLAYIVFSNSTSIETYSYSEYVVVVHEGVDCKEFLEKYEIIEQNGDLITIKEREIENDNT